MIQLKITSLIRFTQGHEVSVADFYLALVGEKRVVDIYFCLVSFSVSGVTGKSQDFHRKSFRYLYIILHARKHAE